MSTPALDTLRVGLPPRTGEADAGHADTPAARAGTPVHGVERRKMPYPYRAWLAICSDLDETPDAGVYFGTLDLLNGSGPTRFGRGFGLEVGSTIYFDMPPGQFSYWNADDRARSAIRALIRSGHIDCLHSFGDLATTRGHAGRALDELTRYGCRLEVWVDHAVAPTNFGADIMRGSGDVPGAAAFHADLSCAFGIEHVWRGRVTSVVGQGADRDLAGIFQPRHPIASGITRAKEWAKGRAARFGPKYAMHASNDVLRRSTLRSGHSVLEFLRCNPHWGGVSRGETADGVHEVLSAPMLGRLAAREGWCVLYTHLGKLVDPAKGFSRAALDAFGRLALAHHDGRILVTTTRRLLGYGRARAATWKAAVRGGALWIDVSSRVGADRLAAADLAGLTFYVPDAARARLAVDGVECPAIERNPPDHTGRASVSLPRPRLAYPRP
ncbi:MAG: hypothetical protein IT176_03190 [Acidobacteria bacterium]|nr:hypothetical protein [Acidobacteriota bacterium]